MALIEVKDLTIGYDSHAVAEHLAFAVNEGDYLFLLGENGSGKSTLMKTLLGLRKPLSGSISFEKGLKDGTIGYLPQQTNVQKDFPASVREVVLSGCQGKLGHRPFYGKAERKLAEDNMEKMGILPLANRCYRELSGGQQQRVLLARALCATRELLVLDEPVTGLDPMSAAEMYRRIEALNREGVTIIMISHDMEAAFRYASHVLHLGRSSFYGTAKEFFDSRIGQLMLLREGEKS